MVRVPRTRRLNSALASALAWAEVPAVVYDRNGPINKPRKGRKRKAPAGTGACTQPPKRLGGYTER